MTSKRKIAANQKNALRSTGPRTANGKICASGNARRHGLSASQQHDPALSAQLDALARTFAGDASEPSQIASAFVAAEAEIHIRKIRAARTSVMTLMAARLANNSVLRAVTECPDGAGPGIAAFEMALPELEKIDRYERRARSKRKRALRAMR